MPHVQAEHKRAEAQRRITGMGHSIDLRVTITEIDTHRGVVTYFEHAEYPDETITIGLSMKAAKALRGEQAGDTAIIVVDYDAGPYKVIQARRITGTLEGRIEAIEAALNREGIEF